MNGAAADSRGHQSCQKEVNSILHAMILPSRGTDSTLRVWTEARADLFNKIARENGAGGHSKIICYKCVFLIDFTRFAPRILMIDTDGCEGVSNKFSDRLNFEVRPHGNRMASY
jgi:hypothetical protein